MNKDIIIKGGNVDENTRCEHYSSPLDIIAIRFKCCKEYYACYYCHEEYAKHPGKIWNIDEFETKAIFCGRCSNEITITAYLNSNNQCPVCNAKFNPSCSMHYHFYFEQL